jgi:fructokinase
MTRIVVAGEALIDLLATPDGGLRAVRGGGPYTTARTIARLGGDVAFLGRLSTDRFGQALRDGLAADGVALDHVESTDAPTTLAVAELDATGTASYRFYLDGTSATGLGEARADAVLAAGPAALHVGTLGLVLEPIGSVLERLVARADALVMLDVNARPSATPDLAAFRARIRRLATRAQVVKASDDDLAVLAPDRAPELAIHDLLTLGAQVVLRTDGGRAVGIHSAHGARTLPVPPVAVVDSVGAGDAFGGAFLAEWLDRAADPRDLAGDVGAVEAAVTFAIRVAAITCTRAGADPPTRAEVDAASPASDDRTGRGTASVG